MSVLDLERWNAVSPHLDHALELDEAGRQGLLDALAQRDPTLAADLRMLLARHRILLGRRFLEDQPSVSPDLLVTAGQAIGPYELVSHIADGGMGTVWLAERRDGRFERKVAIKLLNLGLVGLPAGRRFLLEGALLAQLRHPNIAGLIDAGLLPSGRPYLVLEYVDGIPIDEYCDGRRLDVAARIRLLLCVMSAVEHAHAHLVVHRDIKPDNVLVTPDGDVKLLDFGIAKLLAESDQLPAQTVTREGGAVLTPAYAAPEQIAGESVSTATDVYALGVLSYELLAGRHPGGGDLRTPAGVVRSILETVPPPVSAAVTQPGDDADTVQGVASRRGSSPERLRRMLQGDLDTIVAKALKKVPAERYPSVAAFADDLQRYLSHRPIGARPDSIGYRTSKFVRRHRGVVAASLLGVIAALAGIAATLVQAKVARTQRDFALAQIERAETLNDLNNFLLVDAAPDGQPFTVSSLLRQAERIAERQQASETARAHLLVSIGGQYAALEEIEEAKRVLEQAYARSRHSTEPTIRAQAACTLAETLVLAGDPGRAQQLVDEGLRELPQAPQYALERASCLLRASRIAREAGSPDEAIRLAREAQDARARAPYRSSLLDLRAAMDLAESYNQAGRFRESIAAFEQAAAQLAALGRDRTTTAGTLYNNWALSLSLMGRPLDAEALFRRAIDISRGGAGNEAVAPMLMVNYARSLREMGRLDEAASYAEQGYAKALSVDHAVVVNQSLLVRATIERERHHLETAAAALDEFETRLREALPASHYAFAALAMERAQLALASGQATRARELIDQGVEIAEADRRATGRSFALPRLLTRRAEILLELGKHDAAIQDAEAALEVLRADTPQDLRTSLIGQAYLALGRAQLGLGRTTDAAAALALALEHLESAVGPNHPQTQFARRLADPGAAG